MLNATSRGGPKAFKAFLKEVSSSGVGPLDSAVGTVRTIGSTPPTPHKSMQIGNVNSWQVRRRHTFSVPSSPISRPSSVGRGVLHRQLSTTIHNNPHHRSASTLRDSTTQGRGKGGGDTDPPTPSSEDVNRQQPVNLAYISYERKDSAGKSPLVVQHGLFGCKENWKKISKEINLMSKRSVFAVDGRNHGESPHSLEMSLPLMAKDLHHFVSQIGLQKVSFMGHNTGGRIGMMLALLYPKVVDRLVVVDTNPLRTLNGPSMNSPILHATAVLKNMEPELRQCQGYSRGLKAEKAIEHILKDTRDRAVVLSNLVQQNGSWSTANGRPEKVTTNGVKPDPNSLWRVNLDAVLSNPCLTEFPDFGSGSGAPTFEGKTLFIQGKQSPNMKPSDEPRIRRLFPNAQFVWMEDTGSWMHLEKKQEFLQHVLKFLEKREG